MKKHSIQFWVTFLFIIIAAFENAFPLEKPLYIFGVFVLGALFLNSGMRLKINSTLLWIPFIVYQFLSCLWSPNTNAVSGMFNFVVTIIFLILQVQFTYSKEEFELFKSAFIIQGIILVMLCIMFGSYMDNRFWIKNGAYGVDPNYLAAWCILPICFIVERIFRNDIKVYIKLLMIIEGVSLIYYVLQSGSRSGLITVGAALILCFLYRCKDIIRKHPLQSIIILVAIPIMIYIVIQFMPKTMMMRLLNSNKNLGGRGTQWHELIDIMKNNIWIPLIGRGYGSVTYYTTGHLVAHNTYLDILFAEGIVGIGLYVYFLVSNVLKIKRTDMYLFIGSCAMMVMLFVLSAISVRSSTLWYFMIAIGYKLNKES